MKGTFEVTAEKDGKRIVKYLTLELFNGIANVIYDRQCKLGYTNINIHLI